MLFLQFYTLTTKTKCYFIHFFFSRLFRLTGYPKAKAQHIVYLKITLLQRSIMCWFMRGKWIYNLLYFSFHSYSSVPKFIFSSSSFVQFGVRLIFPSHSYITFNMSFNNYCLLSFHTPFCYISEQSVPEQSIEMSYERRNQHTHTSS